MMHLLMHAGASTDIDMSSAAMNERGRMLAPTCGVEKFREGSIPRVFEAVEEIEEEAEEVASHYCSHLHRAIEFSSTIIDTNTGNTNTQRRRIG